VHDRHCYGDARVFCGSLYIDKFTVLIKGKNMSTFKLIEILETKQRLQNEDAILVDTRDAQSYATDHVKGAFNLHNDTLKEFVDKVEFDTPVFVVCYHGNSSKGVAQYLAEQGYEDIYSVEGGMVMWRQLFPVEA
jgi:thiosulfate sulfurtransferase